MHGKNRKAAAFLLHDDDVNRINTWHMVKGSPQRSEMDTPRKLMYYSKYCMFNVVHREIHIPEGEKKILNKVSELNPDWKAVSRPNA